MESEGQIYKVSRGNLVDGVTEQLISLIESGVWPEGEQGPSENQMAREFNVGRGVIREALQRLRSQHLIVTHHGLGSFVCNPDNFESDDAEMVKIDLSENDFKSFYDLRACIESRAVFLSAHVASEEDFEHIREALNKMEACAKADDLEGFTAADLAFHTAIVECSHSSMLIKAYKSCKTELYSGLYELNRVRGGYSYALRSHRQLCAAICSRDSEQVMKVMEKMQAFNSVRYAGLFKPE